MKIFKFLKAMNKSFFYIPAGNFHFFSALEKFKPDYFVFDLEDSVESGNLTDAISLIDAFKNDGTIPIFVRLWKLEPSIVSEYINLFKKYKYLILPKVSTIDQLDLFFTEVSKCFNLSDFTIVILIESPEGVINIKEILAKFSEQIWGVGFGSHDYCHQVGALHSKEYFSYARNTVLLHCKAFGKLSIDIASVNISNENLFIEECKDGFNLGFSAKPILHPWQLEIFQKIDFYDESEIIDALELYKIFGGFLPEDLSAVQINGKIIEKPHIQRVNQVIKFLLNKSEKL